MTTSTAAPRCTSFWCCQADEGGGGLRIGEAGRKEQAECGICKPKLQSCRAMKLQTCKTSFSAPNSSRRAFVGKRWPKVPPAGPPASNAEGRPDPRTAQDMHRSDALPGGGGPTFQTLGRAHWATSCSVLPRELHALHPSDPLPCACAEARHMHHGLLSRRNAIRG